MTPTGMGMGFDVGAAMAFGQHAGADMALFAELIIAGRAGAFAGLDAARQRRRESKGD